MVSKLLFDSNKEYLVYIREKRNEYEEEFYDFLISNSDNISYIEKLLDSVERLISDVNRRIIDMAGIVECEYKRTKYRSYNNYYDIFHCEKSLLKSLKVNILEKYVQLKRNNERIKCNTKCLKFGSIFSYPSDKIDFNNLHGVSL